MDTLFWTLSKLLWVVASPEKVVLILLFTGTVLIWTTRQKLGRWLISIATLMCLVCILLPLNVFLMQPLEERFPVPTGLPENLTGIIVLAGPENRVITGARGQPSFSDGAERLITFVALARRYPQARLIYAGGKGTLTQHGYYDTTETARKLFKQLGLNSDRVMFDAKARNTFENAVNIFKLMEQNTEGDWVLITSAFHMPRSVGIFRKIGWNVIPFPVDYRTSGKLKNDWKVGSLHNLLTFSRGLHEWLGLIAYWVTGKTSALFPKPTPVGGDINVR